MLAEMAIDGLYNSAALLGLEARESLPEADRDSGVKSGGSSESPASSTCSLSAPAAHQRRAIGHVASGPASGTAVRVVVAVELEMARFGSPQLMALADRSVACWLPGARHSIGVLSVGADTSWSQLDDQVRARWRSALSLLDPSGALGLPERALCAYSLASHVRDLCCFGTCDLRY